MSQPLEELRVAERWLANTISLSPEAETCLRCVRAIIAVQNGVFSDIGNIGGRNGRPWQQYADLHGRDERSDRGEDVFFDRVLDAVDSALEEQAVQERHRARRSQ